MYTCMWACIGVMGGGGVLMWAGCFQKPIQFKHISSYFYWYVLYRVSQAFFSCMITPQKMPDVYYVSRMGKAPLFSKLQEYLWGPYHWCSLLFPRVQEHSVPIAPELAHRTCGRSIFWSTGGACCGPSRGERAPRSSSQVPTEPLRRWYIRHRQVPLRYLFLGMASLFIISRLYIISLIPGNINKYRTHQFDNINCFTFCHIYQNKNRI